MVQRVFDLPMSPHNFCEAGRRQRLGEQIVAGGSRRFAVDLARRGDFADRLQARKAMGFGEPGDVVDDLGAAGLDPAVIAVGGGGDLVRWGLGIVEQEAHVLEQRRLVALERQAVVAAAFKDRLGGRFLGVHGVGGDDLPLERQEGQQLGQRADLVALAVDATLAEHQALLDRPGAHQVERSAAVLVVERAPHRFAVHRDHAAGALDLTAERPDEPAEGRFKGLKSPYRA